MKLLSLLYALGLISAMQIAPERHEMEYVNHKYLKSLSITFRKLSRNSPHYVNTELVSNVGVGNNLTIPLYSMYQKVVVKLKGVVQVIKLNNFLHGTNIVIAKKISIVLYNTSMPTRLICPLHLGRLKMELFEFLGGHYIPTGVVGAYKLCDFLYKEPFFGTMYAKQIPGNWTCPFPAGEYHFMNLTIHLENFPYNIPFTYSSMIVRTRADVQGIFTNTNEEVFRWKTFIKITQKMKDAKKKTKPLIQNFNKALVVNDFVN